MTLSPEAAHYRALHASLRREQSANAPEVLRARRALKTARLADHVTEVVNAWPPLTPAQLDRVAALLASAPRTEQGDATR